MTGFEDRVRRIAREAMHELGRDAGEIEDIAEPPGAGESQEEDEVRRALQYRFPA
jgi:hypothetical protein